MPASGADRAWPLRLDAKRRSTLPVELLEEAHIEVTDQLLAHVEEEGRIVLETREAVRRRLQQRFAEGRRRTGAKRSPVDELLAERAADSSLDA
jgi:bifunctional DNA-binding transcriptional regulator/antitoxin component of YhaV-PrlF toxin-antitoxin module